MFTKKMFKKFGLKGKDVSIMFKNAPDKIFDNFFMPAKVVEEYDKYFVVEIKPHYNPYICQGISRPYRFGVNKTCLWLGDTVMKYNGRKVMQ